MGIFIMAGASKEIAGYDAYDLATYLGWVSLSLTLYYYIEHYSLTTYWYKYVEKLPNIILMVVGIAKMLDIDTGIPEYYIKELSQFANEVSFAYYSEVLATWPVWQLVDDIPGVSDYSEADFDSIPSLDLDS